MNARPMRIYMDTSALVKLVVAEDESESLMSFLGERAQDGLFSAALARTELYAQLPRTALEPSPMPETS